MRMYIYIDKDFLKSLAPQITNISFDIDFFEYSEKRGYTVNNNTNIKPNIENGKRIECKEENKTHKNSIEISEDKGVLCNVEILKRYINIEDVAMIKNNNFYYKIVEAIEEDNRVKISKGIISELKDNSFVMDGNTYLIHKDISEQLEDIYNNGCEIYCLGYKINCLDAEVSTYKVISLYIE